MEIDKNSLTQKINADRKLCLKYEFLNIVGSGCFGTVYKAINQKTKKSVAIKIEFIQKISEKRDSNLLNQITILEKLKGVTGVPKIFNVGKWQSGIYMQMELLSSSLHEEKNKQFTVAEIKAIGAQLIQILRRIHERGIVHQDLKPQNIMRNSFGNLIIIDFGLASFYKSTMNKQKKRGFIGTPRYASLASHKGNYQTPKDDIESLLYVLGAIFLKKAPWFQLKSPVSERLQMIAKYKRMTNKDWLKKCGKHFLQTYQCLEELKDERRLPEYGTILSYFQHHRQTIVLKQNVLQQLQKWRRKSDTGLTDLPLIQIHYAERYSNVNQGLNNGNNLDDIKQNGRSYASFSQMAQNGLEMMQLLTQKLLSFNSKQQQNQISQQTDIGTVQSSEPQIINIGKYANLSFKNPFCI